MKRRRIGKWKNFWENFKWILEPRNVICDSLLFNFSFSLSFLPHLFLFERRIKRKKGMKKKIKRKTQKISDWQVFLFWNFLQVFCFSFSCLSSSGFLFHLHLEYYISFFPKVLHLFLFLYSMKKREEGRSIIERFFLPKKMDRKEEQGGQRRKRRGKKENDKSKKMKWNRRKKRKREAKNKK